MDTEALLAEALAQIGVPVVRTPHDAQVDFVIDVDGSQLVVEAKRSSLVDGATASTMVRKTAEPGRHLVVVGDRITEEARSILRSHRVGYLDLRGRLELRAPGFVVAADVQPVTTRPERTDPLAGRAGLEVAAALLVDPERAASVRGLARKLGRSPSTVSEVLAALRREHLVDDDNAVRSSDLFWRVADTWRVDRVHLSRPPMSTEVGPLRMGLPAEGQPGWALSDTAAALAYGVPLAARRDHALDFFVPDRAVQRRAMTLLGVAPSPDRAAATVRVAPVPAVVLDRLTVARSSWPVAHPVFVALDLAQDVGRGREVLDAWTPDGPGRRVW